ncbi:MAG: DUF721 domain-containing protein [Bacteroidales bacterium]|nr:DUF721 domain-containing protein [Bacteroidales bacterium]
MFKNDEPKKVADLLADALRQYNFNTTVDKEMVFLAYRNVVGEFLMKMTWKIDFKPESGILFLKLGSPSMKQEFSYKLTDLQNAINKRVGSDVVKKIVLT